MTETPEHSSTPFTIESIVAAAERWDETARLRQKGTISYAFIATCFAPFAVVLLAIQVAFEHRREVGETLIGLELALLAIVLVLSYTGFGPNPVGWAAARIRAEILRREKFLLLARIGPYQGLDHPSGEIGRRIMAIEVEETDPAKLLLLSDAQGHWGDHRIEAHHPSANEINLLEILRDYSENRIGDQLRFYRKKAREHHSTHAKLEAIAKSALVLALIASVAHLAYVSSAVRGVDPGPGEHFITIASLVLPTVTAAVAGWQSFCQANRLKLTYHMQAEALEQYADRLSRLEDKVLEASASGDSATHPVLCHEFRRLVLRAEEAMANEQIQWWTLINSWTATA